MKLRLFVALDLPAPARAARAAFRAAAADPAVWRPVPDEALHLTLAFLGHRPAEDADRAAEILAAAPDAPPAARAAAPRRPRGPSLAPPRRRPRVLTAAIVDHDGTLAELQAWVSRELAAAGLYEPEARAFRPHATVARLPPDARAGREPVAPRA